MGTNKVNKLLFRTHSYDCLKAFATIEDNSVDLIITDPPYRITPYGSSGTLGGMFITKNAKKGKLFDNTDVDHKAWLKESYRVLKDGSHFYLMTNQLNMPNFIQMAKNAGFKYQKALIWDKGNKIPCGWYMMSFEFILFFRKCKAKRINNQSTPDILRVPNIKTKSKGKNLHNTEKPVELMKVLIENSSQEGDLVLDPFMGIGSVGVACMELNRSFEGCEIYRPYFHISNNRMDAVLRGEK